MKVRLSWRPYVSYIMYVTFNRGYYTVNFSTSKISFSPGKPPKEFKKFLYKNCMVDFKKAYNVGEAKIISLQELNFPNHGYKYSLDLIKGTLPPYENKGGKEAFLSAEIPFTGTLYDNGDSCETFSNLTIRLRRQEI